jgi:hypothetical protein
MTKRNLEWEKDIIIWVTVKRMTSKIRSLRGPLIKDYEKSWNWGVLVGNWIEFWELEFLSGTSEKGSTRKHTENWVTRWAKLFLGELGFLCWIAKEIGWRVLGLVGIGKVGVMEVRGRWGGGTLCEFPKVFWGNFVSIRVGFVSVLCRLGAGFIQLTNVSSDGGSTWF